jgi:hypothetical protein
MIWEYHRKEVADRRFDAYLVEMADQGWELFYARRGKETRVARDPDFWEVIWKRPKRQLRQLEEVEAPAELSEAMSG